MAPIPFRGGQYFHDDDWPMHERAANPVSTTAANPYRSERIGSPAL